MLKYQVRKIVVVLVLAILLILALQAIMGLLKGHKY